MTWLRSSLRTWCVATCLAAVAPAQEAREARFLAAAAAKLHRHAQSCFKAGCVLEAKRVWLEIVAEYDPDHEGARQALGHTRVGTAWVPDPSRPYPAAEEPPPSRCAALEKKWQSLARALGEDHSELAQALAASGAAERAAAHARRALRFAPGDAAAAAVLGYGAFDGIFGDPVELTILSRSAHLRQAVAFLAQAEPAVEVLGPDEKQPLLERAGVRYRGVRSASFTVWGDLPVTQLEEAARWAERSLWFCRTAFAGRRGFRTEPVLSAQLGFFRDLDIWKQILLRNRELFDAPYLEFLLEHCQAAYLNEGSRCLFVANEDAHDRVFDQAVRTVADDLAALRADGLKEGIGHAVVGMFFGRNLIYLVDQEGPAAPAPHTASAAPDEEDAEGEVLHPDLEQWQRIAAELAWSGESLPAAALPLVKADRFKTADRVKAWALCDYLLRRDPDLLRAFDEAAEGAAVPGDVARTFASRAKGHDAAELEADWRRFWTEAERLREPAMRRPGGRASTLERQAESWLNALNSARLRLQLTPVGRTAWDDPAGRELASALVAGKPLPEDVAELARRTLWSVRGKPAEAVDAWLDRPRSRHAVLDPALRILGFAQHAGVTLLHLGDAPADPTRSTQVYPPVGATGVPVQVAAADLGPDVREHFAGLGQDPPARLGYPISLHLRAPPDLALADVECLVRCNDVKVDGFVIAQPSFAVFYPLEPLQSQADLAVSWSWRIRNQGARFREQATFRTR